MPRKTLTQQLAEARAQIAKLEADLIFREDRLKKASAACEELAGENTRLEREIEEQKNLAIIWCDAARFKRIQLEAALASGDAAVSAHEAGLAEVLGLKLETEEE